MKTAYYKFLAGIALILVGFLFTAPIKAEAKTINKAKKIQPAARRLSLYTEPYRDDGLSTNKCQTSAIKAKYEASVKRMNADIEKYDKDNDVVAKKYRDNVALIWDAMQQPYCGHGSRGISAVMSSFVKSVERTRNAFFAEIKK